MIGGLQKVTLLDFPGKVACTVFLTGCDLRCPYCHINMPHLLVTSGAVKKEKKLGLPQHEKYPYRSQIQRRCANCG